MGRPPKYLKLDELGGPLRQYWQETNRKRRQAEAKQRAQRKALDKRRRKCRCEAYPWPHRPNGGLCRWPAPPTERWQRKPGGRPYRNRYAGILRQIARASGQILPKIFRGTRDRHEQVRQATGNLLHMLEVVGQIGVREHGLASMLRRDVDWFEILTRLFATHLMEQWERGPFRSYRAHDDEIPVLRGTWRVADQLRHPHRKHVLAVTYDQFSADNPLNRLVRFVTEQLWRLTADAENRGRLAELRTWMDEVTLPAAFTAVEADAIVLTRLNQRYEPLLNLARLFVGGSSLQVAAGEIADPHERAKIPWELVEIVAPRDAEADAATRGEGEPSVAQGMRQLVEAMVPDPAIRNLCLSAFADSIARASVEPGGVKHERA